MYSFSQKLYNKNIAYKANKAEHENLFIVLKKFFNDSTRED